MCCSHFSSPLQAGYAYRSIAQFVKHVTQNTSYLDNFPFPELYREIAFEESVTDSDSELVKITRAKAKSKPGVPWFRKKPKHKSLKEPVVEKENADLTAQVDTGPTPVSDGDATEGVDTDAEEPDKGEGTSSLPMVRGRESRSRSFLITLQGNREVVMMRERVDVHGKIRPMEPVEEMPVLRIPPGQIGLIKEAPVRRWLLGQGAWDERFKGRSKKVLKKRKEFEAKAEEIIRHVTGQGLVVNTEGDSRPSREPTGEGGGGEQDEVRPKLEPQRRQKSSRSALTTATGIIDENLRFGPLDLDDENPPPSAIAKRRDTVSRTIVFTNFLGDLNPTFPLSLRQLRCLGNASITPHRRRTTRFRRGKPWK